MDYEALNQAQPESENDSFTVDRYIQFYRHFDPKHRIILDVGCNTGRGGQALKLLSSDLKIYALDAVQNRLDRLPNEVYSGSIKATTNEIPAKDEFYDVIVAGEFIEHLYPSDVERTISEFFRVIKVGGRVLLTTPNPYDIKRILRKRSILGGAHLTQHYPEILKLRLKMAGFSRVRVYGSGRVSKYLGKRFPLFLYGSYLIIADKF